MYGKNKMRRGLHWALGVFTYTKFLQNRSQTPETNQCRSIKAERLVKMSIRRHTLFLYNAPHQRYHKLKMLKHLCEIIQNELHFKNRILPFYCTKCSKCGKSIKLQKKTKITWKHVILLDKCFILCWTITVCMGMLIV